MNSRRQSLDSASASAATMGGRLGAELGLGACASFGMPVWAGLSGPQFSFHSRTDCDSLASSSLALPEVLSQQKLPGWLQDAQETRKAAHAAGKDLPSCPLCAARLVVCASCAVW